LGVGCQPRDARPGLLVVTLNEVIGFSWGAPRTP